MPMLDSVADSTDWLNTPLAELAPIESSLRCQVCKDFYTTPMITSCSHTFCSLCIRRYLSQEGRCPACRESDQEVKLRRNWVVEELVTHFQAGRTRLLQHAHANTYTDEHSVPVDEHERPVKRRRIQQEPNTDPILASNLTQNHPRRSTRSQSRNVSSQNEVVYEQLSPTYEIQDSDYDDDEGSEFVEAPESKPKPKNHNQDDGLVACPICNRRMKEIYINRHLDSNCQETPIAPLSSPVRSSTPQQRPIPHGQSRPAPMAREKLPTINYSLLSDAALRKKLKDLGIPNHGSKELMKKRHIEWMNLWNASCDAQNPTSKAQLYRDLDQWERTLGKQIDRGPSGVMVKDFDRDNWQKSNKSDFDDLIKKARERAAANKQASGRKEDNDSKPSNTVTAAANGLLGTNSARIETEPESRLPSNGLNHDHHMNGHA